MYRGAKDVFKGTTSSQYLDDAGGASILELVNVWRLQGGEYAR